MRSAEISKLHVDPVNYWKKFQLFFNFDVTFDTHAVINNSDIIPRLLDKIVSFKFIYLSCFKCRVNSVRYCHFWHCLVQIKSQMIQGRNFVREAMEFNTD